MAINSHKSENQKGGRALAIFVGALAVLSIVGIVVSIGIEITDARAAMADEAAVAKAAGTSRLTILYIADRDKLEKWLLDTNTGKRRFIGYVPWSEFEEQDSKRLGIRRK